MGVVRQVSFLVWLLELEITVEEAVLTSAGSLKGEIESALQTTSWNGKTLQTATGDRKLNY